MCWQQFFISAGVSVSIAGVLLLRRRIITQRELQIQERRQEEMLLRRRDAIWNTVLFFPDYPVILYPNREDTTTRQLIWYLEQASGSLVMCLYYLSRRMLEDALCAISRKGVVVKIVSNRPLPGRERLENAGVQLRPKRHRRKSPWNPKRDYDLMHHKFVVVDDFAVLTGSANWTDDAITLNRENVVVTTHSASVLKYRAEFDRLWLESAPEPPTPTPGPAPDGSPLQI